MHTKLLTLCMALCAVCLTATSQNVPDYVPTEELVAWWPMNGNVDDAIGSLDGFNQGGVETDGPDGQIGQALELPSGDDYIDLPTGGVSEEGGLTLAFWAWLELPAEGAAPLIDRIEVSNNLWSFSYEQSSETVHFITRNNDGSGYHNLSTWSPPAAEWVHVTSVYRAPSGLKELHVNGSIVGAELAPLEGFTMPTMRLGEVAEGTWNSNCRFSEVGIWSRSLTEEEILALYNAQLPVPGCTDSIACNFNEEANMKMTAASIRFSAKIVKRAVLLAAKALSWDVTVQACVVSDFCQEDLDGDGVIGVNDLMQLLSVFGTDCPIWMCGDPVNYHGYDYATVQIGEQCWFAENLQTTKYLSGDEISNLTTALNEEWQYADSGAYSNYQYWNLSEVEMVSLYGRLYNQFAVQDERGLCPNDWHVPHRFEFEEMIEFVGGEEEAGDALKSSPEDTPSWTGNNSSGFSGAPGGLRDFHGPFSSFGGQGFWWSQTFTEMGVVGGQGEVGFYWGFRLNNNGVSGFNEPSSMGTSIRCIKDTQ